MMVFKYLPLHRHQISFTDILPVSGDKKPAQELVEEKLKAYLGSSVKVVGSGRYGLKIILKALNVGLGDEVIIPAFICPSVVDAVVESGATPVFADVAECDVNMDPTSAEEAITDSTKAIVIAYLFGIPAQVDKFLELSKRYGIPIVEDCGQAFGAKYGDSFAGTHGDFGFFSFGISKNISGVGGGAICWKENRAEQVRSMLEQTAFRSKPQHESNSTQQYFLALSAPLVFNKYAYGAFRSFISRYSDSRRLSPFSSYEGGMTNLEARLVLKQLSRYNRILNVRNKNAEVYRECLCQDFRLINIPEKATPAYLYFPILVDNAEVLQRELALRSIEVKGKKGMYFAAMYKDPRFDRYRYTGSNVEKVEDDYLLLPTGYSRNETEWICRQMLKVGRS